MAAHTNDKSILGDGLQWNVRSYMLERRIDFSALDSLDTSKYYEIGTLPKGFVPRNIALVQLTGVDTASTFKVSKTVESAASGTATEIASLPVTAPRTPASSRSTRASSPQRPRPLRPAWTRSSLSRSERRSGRAS